jgi:quinol monooxygenase YgiN
MITFIAQLKVAPENGTALEALLSHVRDMSLLHEPGVAYYAFGKSVDEADTYVVIEVYRDADAHAAHMETEWVTGSLPKSMQLIDGRPAINQYVSPGTQPAVRRLKES